MTLMQVCKIGSGSTFLEGVTEDKGLHLSYAGAPLLAMGKL
jgi:hypothetical protein